MGKEKLSNQHDPEQIHRQITSEMSPSNPNSNSQIFQEMEMGIKFNLNDQAGAGVFGSDQLSASQPGIGKQTQQS